MSTNESSSNEPSDIDIIMEGESDENDNDSIDEIYADGIVNPYCFEPEDSNSINTLGNMVDMHLKGMCRPNIGTQLIDK